jgi:hypothetical protein
MKVLLDECLSRPLRFDFIGHAVDHVTEMGWSGAKIGIIVLLAKSNRIDDLQTVIPEALNVMKAIPAGQVAEVKA